MNDAETNAGRGDRSSLLADLRPTGGVVIFAAFCGVLTFLGVLLLAPEPERNFSGGGSSGPYVGIGEMRGYIERGLHAEGVEAAREAIEAGNADLGTMMFYAWAAEQAGKQEVADPVWARIKSAYDRTREPADMWNLLTAGWGELRAGDPARARELFLKSAEVSLSAPEAQRGGYAYYNAACAMALAGETEQAIDLLEQSIRGGFIANRGTVEWIRLDPDFVESGLTQHPRFGELVKLAESIRDAPVVDEFESNLAPEPEPDPRAEIKTGREAPEADTPNGDGSD